MFFRFMMEQLELKEKLDVTESLAGQDEEDLRDREVNKFCC